MFKTSGNQLQALCNRLHALNFKFKICKFVSEMNLATGNRLHPLIIDYQRENTIYLKSQEAFLKYLLTKPVHHQLRNAF